MIKPLLDRVVLKAINDTKTITQSGIYLPESSNKERPFIYEVISVWPGKKDIEIWVKPWDKVLCWQYAWDEVKVDSEEYKIVAMEYILGIVE